MPNSLRCMLSKLRHKGQISDAEYKELITKLENHDKVIKEDIKAEIKRAIIQSNKDLNDTGDNYDRGWLGGNLEIVRILEKHYGKIIDEDEIMKESEEEE